MVIRRFQKAFSTGFAAVILALGLAQSVSAHGFNVLLLGSVLENYPDVYDAFRLATKEKDGHANEESDGHLGGLDVYILTINEDNSVTDTLDESTVDIVVMIGPKAIEPALQSDVEARGIVFLGIENISPKMRIEFMGNTATSDTSAFQNAFGREISNAAEASYVAARMIEIAVRSQEGVDDRTALAEVLAQY